MLTVSARVGENAELFAQILALHVPPGSLIADVTYGLGAFWKKVPANRYRVLASDIALKPALPSPPGFTLQSEVDCRALPYAAASLDAVVLDPPYMEGMYRREVGHMAGSGSHAAFRRAYSASAPTEADRRPALARRRRRPLRPRRSRGGPRPPPRRHPHRQVSGRG